MADEPLYSSQGSHYEQHQILDNQENALPSSPVLSGSKPKRAPTVTPKRFKKFFTPRESISTRGHRQSKNGRQLRDITRNGGNRRFPPIPPPGLGGDALLDGPLKKRRKLSFDLASSPPQSSPIKHVQIANEVEILGDVASPSADSDVDLVDLLKDFRPFPKPVRRLRQYAQSRGILERSFGGYDALSRGRRDPSHSVDWRSTTADFATTPEDRHVFGGIALPFCTAGCNTNSLIAIGEEAGGVRIVDPSPAEFSKTHIRFQPHSNAIMDIAFSSDDYLLATASGDQTARIIDMHTRQTICIMSGHTSTVKQVRFQPSDDNIIATSSRDGSVQIWDMRCGGYGSVASLRTAFARNADNGGNEPSVHYSKQSIRMGPAHRSTTAMSKYGEVLDQWPGVSITSIQYLPNGRDNFLVTSSELNSSIKLWDLRYGGRRALAEPISSTLVPKHHERTRNYGLNSLVFSSDGARLYATCRDGAVYAYSANHLILGCAPELTATNKYRMGKGTKAGIGALYAFRHPSMRIGSFYIKSALRHAKGDKSEMLAVGSSDNCAVLFPADERHLPLRERPSDDHEDEEDELPSVPASVPKSTPTAAADDMRIYNQGTALINGHTREVTSLTWTQEGDLVSLSDDSKARCWREDGERARELRKWKEGSNKTWMCGWAGMDAEWDEEDG